MQLPTDLKPGDRLLYNVKDASAQHTVVTNYVNINSNRNWVYTINKLDGVVYVYDTQDGSEQYGRTAPISAFERLADGVVFLGGIGTVIANAHSKRVKWIVNALGELGVLVDGTAFFMYKGESLIYTDNACGKSYRFVGKCEFGEVCKSPLYNVDSSDFSISGAGWYEATPPTTMPTNQPTEATPNKAQVLIEKLAEMINEHISSNVCCYDVRATAV